MPKNVVGTNSDSRPYENMMWEDHGVLCDSQGAQYIDVETEAKRILVVLPKNQFVGFKSDGISDNHGFDIWFDKARKINHEAKEVEKNKKTVYSDEFIEKIRYHQKQRQLAKQIDEFDDSTQKENLARTQERQYVQSDDVNFYETQDPEIENAVPPLEQGNGIDEKSKVTKKIPEDWKIFEKYCNLDRVSEDQILVMDTEDLHTGQSYRIEDRLGRGLKSDPKSKYSYIPNAMMKCARKGEQGIPNKRVDAGSILKMYAVYPTYVADSDNKMKLLHDDILAESKVQILMLDRYRDNPTQNEERTEFRKQTLERMNLLRNTKWLQNPSYGKPAVFENYIESHAKNDPMCKSVLSDLINDLETADNESVYF